MTDSEDESSRIYFAMAEGISSLSPMNFQLGAVIVDKRGNIIAKGYNSYKSHPYYGTKKNQYRYLHAEGAALYDARKRGISVEGCDIYIFRKGGNKAKPCWHCRELLRQEGIRNVFYTDREKTIYGLSNEIKIRRNSIAAG